MSIVSPVGVPSGLNSYSRPSPSSVPAPFAAELVIQRRSTLVSYVIPYAPGRSIGNELTTLPAPAVAGAFTGAPGSAASGRAPTPLKPAEGNARRAARWDSRLAKVGLAAGVGGTS